MSNVSASKQRELAEFISQFYADPLGFVKAAFPWGQAFIYDESGIEMRNPLAEKTGPEPWQAELLEELGRHIRFNMQMDALGMEMLVWRSAVASGHGVGKSALVSWIILFMMATRVDTRAVVTASTQFQLEDKTWPELAKWHGLFLAKHWFKWSAKGYVFAAYPEEKQKNYKTTAATVGEDNTEAFAGLHNEGRSLFVIFDEASGVVPKIWEVAQGALTDSEAFFFAFGNPTQPDGEFPDCFDKHRDMFHTWNVDSREVSHTNKTALADTIKIYGEDSDEVKVRIKGEFPNNSYTGFIDIGGAREAVTREAPHDAGAALIMAVDVARYGDDRSVIGYRQGRRACPHPTLVFKGKSTMDLAELVADEIAAKRPDAVVIESTGPGAGVIDRLRQMGHRVHEVHPGSAAVDHRHFMNKRAEYWDKMRQWLYQSGWIPDDPELLKELTSINYSFDRHEQRILLEAKKDMKKRGLPSPDKADTLALTFAVNVARRDVNLSRRAGMGKLAITEYDPLDY